MKSPMTTFSPLPGMTPMIELWTQQVRIGMEFNQQMMKVAFAPWQMAMAFAPRLPGDAPVAPKAAKTTPAAKPAKKATPSTAPVKAPVAASKGPVLASDSASISTLVPASEPSAKAKPAKSEPAKAAPTKAAAKVDAPAPEAKTAAKPAAPKAPEPAPVKARAATVAVKPADSVSKPATAASATATAAPVKAASVQARDGQTPNSKPVETKPAETKAAGNAPAMLKAPRAGKADDLTVIKGIGPKLAKELNDLGIWHLDQVMGWTKAQAQYIDDVLPTTRGGAVRSDWAGQAKRLLAAAQPLEKTDKS
ncbi:hypothetical protein [Cognatishimia sp. F0-27]|uniref:hypothetical protein n=1 Tax=Cognatishimia sp. F0-27 TaxID=2816855 RepID=UPI001D0C29CB|nr:hypothetical protein [Cognatishimia sp. F0-27]MCC1492306.1 hypothetical protein [Cognatishimia sp. F0-27]